jgi:hypothetical protein
MLAIVIPFYKLQFFEKTLISLNEQTCKDFNLYIGDDASPQDPGHLIEEYQKKFNICYKIFNENLGHNDLVSHWQRCVELLRNEQWVMILGDDDVLEKSCVEHFYRDLPCINENNFDVVRFSSVIINDIDRKISKINYNPRTEDVKSFLIKKISGNSRSSLSEHIFSRKSLNKYGFKSFPLAWHSDDFALLQFSENGKIFSINTSRVFIRKSELNISSDKSLHTIKNKASFNYYYSLLTYKTDIFDENQYKIILSALEQTTLNHRRNTRLLSRLIFIYLQQFRFKRLFGFTLLFIKK